LSAPYAEKLSAWTRAISDSSTSSRTALVGGGRIQVAGANCEVLQIWIDSPAAPVGVDERDYFLGRPPSSAAERSRRTSGSTSQTATWNGGSLKAPTLNCRIETPSVIVGEVPDARLDLGGVQLRDLRHFTSGLIAEGCDVVTVQRAMGHSSATWANIARR
jgi:hypothetical protein